MRTVDIHTGLQRKEVKEGHKVSEGKTIKFTKFTPSIHRFNMQSSPLPYTLTASFTPLALEANVTPLDLSVFSTLNTFFLIFVLCLFLEEYLKRRDAWRTSEKGCLSSQITKTTAA